jgi:hypothetical protein
MVPNFHYLEVDCQWELAINRCNCIRPERRVRDINLAGPGSVELSSKPTEKEGAPVGLALELEKEVFPQFQTDATDDALNYNL